MLQPMKNSTRYSAVRIEKKPSVPTICWPTTKSDVNTMMNFALNRSGMGIRIWKAQFSRRKRIGSRR